MPACHTTRQDACINAALLSEAGQGTRAPQVALEQETHYCCHRVAANHTQLRTQQCPHCTRRQYTHARTHADCCARAPAVGFSPAHSSAKWHSHTAAWLARNIASIHAWIHTRPAPQTNQSIFSHTLPTGPLMVPVGRCTHAHTPQGAQLSSGRLAACGIARADTHTHSEAECHRAAAKCMARGAHCDTSSRGADHNPRA
jgi:hypothetical protein